MSQTPSLQDMPVSLMESGMFVLEGRSRPWPHISAWSHGENIKCWHGSSFCKAGVSVLCPRDKCYLLICWLQQSDTSSLGLLFHPSGIGEKMLCRTMWWAPNWHLNQWNKWRRYFVIFNEGRGQPLVQTPRHVSNLLDIQKYFQMWYSLIYSTKVWSCVWHSLRQWGQTYKQKETNDCVHLLTFQCGVEKSEHTVYQENEY